MAYCKKCGKALDPDAKFCPECGCAQDGTDTVVSTGTTVTKAPNPSDTGSIGWGILGFLIPIAGLILWICWKNEQPKNAHMAGMGALMAVVATVLLYVIILVIAIVAAALAASDSLLAQLI